MTSEQTTLRVRVRSISYAAAWINAYEVVPIDAAELPTFASGAHIDVVLRDGRVRQYSLCNSPAERHRYIFAVQYQATGRGGSRAIFETVHVGSILTISKPRNHFPINAAAEHHLLLAGGIGITPFMSMMRDFEATGRSYDLHYVTRSRDRTAFLEELEPRVRQGRVRIYHDDGDPARGPDFEALLRHRAVGSHLYFCGPAGFMTAVRAASTHWPPSAIHCEYFTTPTSGADSKVAGSAEAPLVKLGGFKVQIASTGAVLEVPDGTSIVEVLRAHGLQIATSCESGICGTCRTRYIAGVPEHHDFILSEEEKIKDVLICCARSRTPILVLDL